jgi:hypothetical protein
LRGAGHRTFLGWAKDEVRAPRPEPHGAANVHHADAFITSSNTTMSDSDLDKETVYLAYRDIFKGNLAKLRRRAKVRNVVEKHKNHLHHKQLADSVNSEKVCSILGDLLTRNLFESDSIAEATFPTLFSPGNGTALIVKCVEDGSETETRQGNGEPPNTPPLPHTLHSPDIPMPKSTSSESASTGTQHRIDKKSSGIRKPARTTRRPAGLVLHGGEGQSFEVKEFDRGGINTTAFNDSSWCIEADYDLLCR